MIEIIFSFAIIQLENLIPWQNRCGVASIEPMHRNDAISFYWQICLVVVMVRLMELVIGLKWWGFFWQALWQAASFTKEVNLRLAKCPLKTNGRLANLELISLIKEGTFGAIWSYGSESTVAQVMTCCLMEPSHYLNNYWPTINWTLGNRSQ